MVSSGITRDELIKWGGDEVFNQGLALCNAGDVSDVKYDDETLTVSGKIEQPNGWAMPVKFKLDAGGRIKSECPCVTNQRYGQVCPHVVAIGIALMVMEMDEAEKEVEREGGGGEGEAENEVEREGGEGGNYIRVPISPKFYALVSGSRAALSVELDAWYGDIDFPACSVQSDDLVFLKDPDDDLVRRVRSMAEEKAAVAELEKWGFQPGYTEGDFKLYMTDPQKVLNFLGAGLPAVRRKSWRVDLSDRLMALTDTMPSVVPVVEVKDAARGDFDVKITFDAMGHDVSPAEIQAAVNRNDGYILHDGQVILLDNRAISAMKDVFGECAVSTDKDVPPGWIRVKGVYGAYVKSSLDLLDCIDLDDTAASHWRETAIKRNDRNPNAKFEPVALGPLDHVLRPYQKQGVYWMRFLEEAGLCGLLADEMGLGKTLQTLTWLSLPRVGQKAKEKHPALIVCPTSLVRNWEAEAKKFAPWLKVLVLSGAERTRLFPGIPAYDVVVTSYALLQRDFETAYYDKEFSALVIDEAQHIKNRETKNAKAVKAVNARCRLALTGTPIENSVADAWSIFDYLMPDYLGDYETFKLNFEDPIRNGDADVPLAKLKRKIHPFIMRRVKKTVAKDLPDKIEKVSYCPMSEEAQRDYLAALQKTRRDAGGLVQEKGFAKAKFEILAMLMKLRKIASQGKKDAFLEQLQSAIDGGHKVLVFSQFVTMLKELANDLRERNIRFCYLDGSTKDRLGECNRFNATPEIQVFLISLMAGGTGLNLTGADMVMHYDPWWNPAVENQATDRAHRIGQKKTVYVMKMIASGSIEERVLALQKRKQAIISATIDTTDAAVMEALTAADLNELLS